jgi:hypothetical protein
LQPSGTATGTSTATLTPSNTPTLTPSPVSPHSLYLPLVPTTIRASQSSSPWSISILRSPHRPVWPQGKVDRWRRLLANPFQR